MTVEFEFDIGEGVKIPALDCEGVVSMARIERIREYYVSYWFEGKYEHAWLPYFELKKL